LSNSVDLAFFSFNRHQDMLIPGLKNAMKHMPLYDKIILVWDDYLREQPVDFDQIQNQIDHELVIIKHTDLDPWPGPIEKWGWIRQQLVKLRCFEYSNADYTWIVDGDVLVTGDPELFINDQPALRYDHERTVNISTSQYHKFINKYFGIDKFLPYTWVGSTCLFDNKICQEMFTICQQRNNKTLIECVTETIKDWPRGIAGYLPLDGHWPFSEFELYGSYCQQYHSEKFYVSKKNWNYATDQRLDLPIQIMWNQFDTDTIEKLQGY